MLEQVKRHVEEYKLLEDSAIPLCLLYEKGKSGESICVKAAKEILRNKLEHQIQELSKETVSKLVDDPDMFSYLGKNEAERYPGGKMPDSDTVCRCRRGKTVEISL